VREERARVRVLWGEVGVKATPTPKAFHSRAQGRRLGGAPWERNPQQITIQTPTGFHTRPAVTIRL
jgi:hypothetical protein